MSVLTQPKYIKIQMSHRNTIMASSKYVRRWERNMAGHAFMYLFIWIIHLLCPEDLPVTFISVSNRSPCFVPCLKPDMEVTVNLLTCHPPPPPLIEAALQWPSESGVGAVEDLFLLVLNQSYGPQGEEHKSFRVVKSVCLGRDGRREGNQIV